LTFFCFVDQNQKKKNDSKEKERQQSERNIGSARPFIDDVSQTEEGDVTWRSSRHSYMRIILFHDFFSEEKFPGVTDVDRRWMTFADQKKANPVSSRVTLRGPILSQSCSCRKRRRTKNCVRLFLTFMVTDPS